MLGTDAAAAVRATLRLPDVDLHVPSLCDVEIGSGLRRALLIRALLEDRARVALDDYLDLPLTRHGHQALLGRMLELRTNFSAYDAVYVTLAERLGAELLTADSRLARSTRAHTGVSVVS